MCCQPHCRQLCQDVCMQNCPWVQAWMKSAWRWTLGFRRDLFGCACGPDSHGMQRLNCRRASEEWRDRLWTQSLCDCIKSTCLTFLYLAVHVELSVYLVYLPFFICKSAVFFCGDGGGGVLILYADPSCLHFIQTMCRFSGTELWFLRRWVAGIKVQWVLNLCAALYHWNDFDGQLKETNQCHLWNLKN